MKRYKAALGAQFNDKKAQVYGEALERLERELGHAPTTDEIWRAAKPSDSPLHDAFQWEVKKAAIQWWRTQARTLIGHIEIFVTVRNKAVPVRGWYNVRRHPEDPQRYVSAESIAESPYMRKQIVDYALREADDWSRKYKAYREFRPIHGAIRKTKKAVAGRSVLARKVM